MVGCRLRAGVCLAVGALVLAVAPAFADPIPQLDRAAARERLPGRRRQPDDAAPNIDWQALQAAGRVVHAPDDNAKDTAFAGGSKCSGRVTGTPPPRPAASRRTRSTSAILGGGRPAGVADVPVSRLHARGRVRLRGDRVRAQPRRAPLAQRPGRDPVSHDRRRGGDHVAARQRHRHRALPVEDRVSRRGHGLREDRNHRGDGHDPGGYGPGRGQRGADHEPAAGTFPPGSQIPADKFGEVALNLSALMEAAFGDNASRSRRYGCTRARRTRTNPRHRTTSPRSP